MAQRRMFSKKITDTDLFLDMPMSTQCLYFHLNMEADDDGFLGNAKTIRRKIGASEDDLKLLIAKEFIIPFESGVVVIRDWKIHNYIQKDRYTKTIFTDEKSQIGTDENNRYKMSDTRCIQNVSDMDTQVRLGKDRLELGKDSVVVAVSEQEKIWHAVASFQTLWNFPNAFQQQDLEELIKTFSDELVNEAIKIAGTKDVPKNNAISFLTAVLREWEQANVKTVEQVEHYQSSRQIKKQPYGSNYPKRRVERSEVKKPPEGKKLTDEDYAKALEISRRQFESG